MSRFAYRLAVVAALAVLLGACSTGPTEPVRAFSEAEVDVLSVARIQLTSGSTKELYVRVRITNPTADKDLPLDARNWYLRLANGEMQRSWGMLHPNTSTCSGTMVAPGGSSACNLYFFFGAFVTNTGILPARVSYSPSGWSSGADVEVEWAGSW